MSKVTGARKTYLQDRFRGLFQAAPSHPKPLQTYLQDLTCPNFSSYMSELFTYMSEFFTYMSELFTYM